MRVTLFAFIVLSASATAAQCRTRYTETLFCTRELQSDNRSWAIVTVEVDRSHRPLRRTLRMIRRGYRATWEYPTEHFDAALPLAELEIPAIELPRETPFPVTVAIRFDGRTVWERAFARATETVMIIPAPGQGARPSFQRGLSISISDGGMPSLIGVSRAEVVVRPQNGSEAAVRDLPLVDWTSAASEISNAFASVEAERRRRACRPNLIVSSH